MKGVFVPAWVLEMDMQYAEKLMLSVVLSMPNGFYGSNTYISEVLRISNENARMVVYRLIKSGVLLKSKTDSGKRLLTPSEDVIRFRDSFDLLQGVTNSVTVGNGGVTVGNKRNPILYIEKEKERFSISKVDTRVHSETKTNSSFPISKKEESIEKVGNVTVGNKLATDSQFVKALREHGCSVPYDDILRIREETGMKVHVNKFGKIPGISGMAKKIQAIDKYGYDKERDTARFKFGDRTTPATQRQVGRQ